MSQGGRGQKRKSRRDEPQELRMVHLMGQAMMATIRSLRGGYNTEQGSGLDTPQCLVSLSNSLRVKRFFEEHYNIITHISHGLGALPPKILSELARSNSYQI